MLIVTLATNLHLKLETLVSATVVTGTARKPDLPRSPAQMARFDGEIMGFFRADLPERKKRFPSWAGAEKFAADLNFGEKNGIFFATGPGTRQMEVTSLYFVL